MCIDLRKSERVLRKSERVWTGKAFTFNLIFIKTQIYTHLRKSGRTYMFLDLRFIENENVDTLEKIWTAPL